MMQQGRSANEEVPPLSRLFSEKRDERHGRKEAAIIIPSFSAPDLLRKHLDKLSKQETSLFDILIIYGMDDRFIDTPDWAGILHLRRCWDFGSAGAFFAGERMAVAEGYDKIILADDDCFPESPHLVKDICRALDKHMYVKPLLSLPPYAEMIETVLAQYGGIRREAFEKVGYTYLPLYSGCEDLELEHRLRKEYGLAARIKGVASHPWFMPPFLAEGYVGKVHNFGHGCAAYRLASGKHLDAGIDIFFRGLKSVACAVIGRDDLAKKYIRSSMIEYERIFRVSNPSRFIREKVSMPEGVCKGEADSRVFDTIFAYSDFERDGWSLKSKGDRVVRRFSEGERMSKKAARGINAMKYFNRTILFDGWFSDWDLQYAVFARRTALRDKGRTYWVTRDRDALAVLIGIAIMIAAVPISAAIALSLTASAALSLSLKSRTSLGYGVSIKP